MSPNTEIVLPTKRVRGETIAERLPENVTERILPARYLTRDASGAVTETPAGLFERVATAVAAAEAEYGGDPETWAHRFEAMLTGLEFMPNSPTLMNAGTENEQLAACFVLSPADSLDSIFETLSQAATIFQSGGGVGYAFSELRPMGDPVGTAGGIASGPVSFMHVFDTMCAEIRQGGRRRGAQMGILRVDHPDIGRFCTAKRVEGSLSNFNISVAITDAFVAAVQADEAYELVNPRTGTVHSVTESTAEFYDTAYEDTPEGTVESNLWRDFGDSVPGIEPYRGRTDLAVGEPMELPARFVWELIVDGAWRNGEPGIFVLDATNREHSFDVEAHPDHRIAATNPCGEQGLETYEACTLGHVNLSLLALPDRTPWFDFEADSGDLESQVETFLDQAIDRDRLTRIVHDGIRFLDDVTTVATFPFEAIEATVASLRKVGLGIMGLAELLIQLGVSYGSPESVEIARQIMAHVDRESKRASHELALERGSFPAWDESKYATPLEYPDWFEGHTQQSAADWPDGFPIRNHNTTTIAPTGTTGMIADASSGCEPLYDVVYFKNVGEDVQGGSMLVEFESYFLETLEANGLAAAAIRDRAMSLLEAGEYRGIEDLDLPPTLTDLFVTATEIPAADHVRMQAALQEHVDSAIAKTINLDADATRSDVAAAYRLAIDLGCKGCTVYRDRSRSEQVLTRGLRTETASRGRPEEARCCPVWTDG